MLFFCIVFILFWAPEQAGGCLDLLPLSGEDLWGEGPEVPDGPLGRGGPVYRCGHQQRDAGAPARPPLPEAGELLHGFAPSRWGPLRNLFRGSGAEKEG